MGAASPGPDYLTQLRLMLEGLGIGENDVPIFLRAVLQELRGIRSLLAIQTNVTPAMFEPLPDFHKA